MAIRVKMNNSTGKILIDLRYLYIYFDWLG